MSLLQGKDGDSLHTNGVLETEDSVRKGENGLPDSSAVSNGPAESLRTVAPDDAAHSGTAAPSGPSTETVKEEPAFAGGKPAESGGALREASAPGSTPQQNGTGADSGKLAAGKMASAPLVDDKEEDSSYHFTKGAYFIGKAVWGKVTCVTCSSGPQSRVVITSACRRHSFPKQLYSLRSFNGRAQAFYGAAQT